MSFVSDLHNMRIEILLISDEDFSKDYFKFVVNYQTIILNTFSNCGLGETVELYSILDIFIQHNLDDF